jgi:starch synthase
MAKLRVLMVAAEAVPFAKSGGLADVLGSLPVSLKQAGVDVRIIMPEYRRIYLKYAGRSELTGTIRVPAGETPQTASVREYITPDGIPVYFIGHEGYYHRSGMYGTLRGDFEDNDERFIFFSRAVFETVKMLKWQPDIIHCHDWHAGLVPVYLKRFYQGQKLFAGTRSVMTVHNLAYQGRFPGVRFPKSGLPWSDFTSETLEFYGDVNFLKGGLIFADAVTTVSPTYSREILSAQQGCGVEGVLRSREKDLHGILNGIDMETWNPETDSQIPANFSARTIARKARNTEALKRSAGLYFPGIHAIPLLGMITRLAEQKGLDLLMERLDDLMHLDIQLIILGDGDDRYRRMLIDAARRYQGKLLVDTAFNESRARFIYAGSDMFLMPSRYEPCGLGQMIAMRYGTVPIVHKTGGLADTVTPFNPKTGEGTGFVFDRYESTALSWGVSTAVELFQKKKLWRTIVENAMRQEFSWQHSVKEYMVLYRKTLRAPRRTVKTTTVGTARKDTGTL